MEPNIIRAIYSLVGNTTAFHYDNGIIEWDTAEEKTNIPQPTKSEIQTELQRLQSEYDSNQYQRDRAEAYPEISDQLDKIYHDGIDAWKADMIKPVKDKYPN